MAGILFNIPDATPPIGGIDEYTKLMLHMDESPLIDSSDTPHNLTLNGGVARSATQSKFGGFSGYFDADDNAILISDHTDFEFGSGDFTIDFWSYPNIDYVGAGEIIAKSDITSYGPFVIYYDATKWHFLYSHNGTQWANAITEIGDSTMDTWQHIAVSRSGSTVYLFKNGIEENTVAIGGDSLFDNSENLTIGYAKYSTPLFSKGYIEELRVSKGIARWTTGFTPETGPYTT